MSTASTFVPAHSEPEIADEFLPLLPSIRRSALFAFRRRQFEERGEAVAEVIASSYAAFVRLIDRGKREVVFPTALARFAIRQFHAGRRVGTSVNRHDLMSPARPYDAPPFVGRLDAHGSENWRHLAVEDHRAGPAETAAFRIDFAAWLERLSPQDRLVASLLSTDEPPGQVARELGLSPGRISQIRKGLFTNWEEFHRESSRVDPSHAVLWPEEPA